MTGGPPCGHPPPDGRQRLALAALALAALVIALVLRLPDLGVRPMHGDEAVHAFKFAELWERGVYRYDPNEYHGPTLYYAALPIVWLRGRQHLGDMQEADFRLATALIGAAMAPLVLLLSDGLGRRAAAIGALLTAVSPAFVFYSRYFIQEVPLAFFTLTALAGGWRYRQSGRAGWLAAAAAAAGLMIATKETAVLTFAAAALAALVGQFSPRRHRGTENSSQIGGCGLRCMARTFQLWPAGALLGVGVALAVAYLLLSGFLSNPGGPVGYFRTFALWGRRGIGETLHVHPWYYYFSLLLWNRAAHESVWTEAFIVLLGLTGAAAALLTPPRPRDGEPSLLRFLAVYTLVLAGVYSLIPYKTPWLLLSFMGGLVLLAGAGAAALLEALRPRAAKALAAAVLLAGTGHLAWQAWLASTTYCTSAGNPYVYAQPGPDVVELGRQVERIAAAAPEKEALVVKVIAADRYYWPLPWYLRRLRNVGYWTSLPSDPEAPISIIAATYDPDETLNSRLPNSLMTGYHGLRPGATFELWVRLDAWQRYLRGLRPPRKESESAG